MTEVKAETGAKHIVKYYVKIVIKSKVIVMVCVIVLKEYCVGEIVCVCVSICGSFIVFVCVSRHTKLYNGFYAILSKKVSAVAVTIR